MKFFKEILGFETFDAKPNEFYLKKSGLKGSLVKVFKNMLEFIPKLRLVIKL
jgi:hypothetical protein